MIEIFLILVASAFGIIFLGFLMYYSGFMFFAGIIAKLQQVFDNNSKQKEGVKDEEKTYN